MPAGYNAVAEYEAVQPPLTREDQLLHLQYDALHGQPARQAARAAATLASLGDLGARWAELNAAQYGHTLQVYQQYLQFR